MCFASEPFVEGCVTRVHVYQVAVRGDATYVVYCPLRLCPIDCGGRNITKICTSWDCRSSWLVEEY